MTEFNRHRTAAQWAASSDIIPLNLAVYESDGMGRHKYGDGVHSWSGLEFPEASSDEELVFVEDDDETTPLRAITLIDQGDETEHKLWLLNGQLMLDGEEVSSGGTP